VTERPSQNGTTFEIRKFVSGRWLLDSVFDDKQYAIAEAKILAERTKAHNAIQVVAVTEDNGQFREWTVFKHQVQADERATGRSTPTKHDAAAGFSNSNGLLQQRDLPTSKPLPRRRAWNWSDYVRLAGGLIVVFGAAVLGFAALKMFP
jgi:hypothetical protein